MNYKSLLLAAATALLPTAGLTMQELPDTDMATVTAQDGVTASVNTSGFNLSNLAFHDTDGFSGRTFDGALITSFTSLVTNAATPFVFTVDVGATAISNGNTTLQIRGSLPAMTINTGNFRLGNSQRDNGGWWIDGFSEQILENIQIVLPASSFNMQLGSEGQTGSVAGTDMLTVSLNGTIQVNGLQLYDTNGGGVGANARVAIPNMRISNASIGGPIMNLDVNLTSAGVEIGVSVPDPVGLYAEMERVYTAVNYIGDFTVYGFKPAADTRITIAGH